MKKNIKVSDIETSKVIKSISESLNIDFEKDQNEYCIRIPKHIGSGYIKAIEFDHGLGVIDADCLLKNELTLTLQKEVVHPLKIMFNREGEFFHSFDGHDEVHTIKHLENMIVSSTPQNNHVFKIPAEKPICFFSLEINRKLFEEKISDFLDNMNEDLMELFRDVNGVNTFFYKSHYSIDISDLIEDFIDCDLEDFMKVVYQEAKAYEILTHQLQQYLDDLNEPQKRVILRQSTIEKIKRAITIIEEEIDTMDNISKLAKRVGLNQNTLQQGFQKLHKASVKEYIRNYRISKAKELLETTELNITEVTYKIGINSRSYFSKIFKQRFGLSPTAFINQVRNQNDNRSA